MSATALRHSYATARSGHLRFLVNQTKIRLRGDDACLLDDLKLTTL
jgi:hypothetical protein